MKRINLLIATLLLCILPSVVMAQNSTEEKADMAFRIGQYEDSKKLYEVALSMTAANSNARVQLQKKCQKAEKAARLLKDGNQYWEQNNKRQADQQYLALMELNPYDEVAKQRHAEYEEDVQIYSILQKAHESYQKGNYSSALRYFEEASRIRPSSKWTYSQRQEYTKSCDWNAYNITFLKAVGEAETKAAAINYLEHSEYTIYRDEVQDYLYGISMKSKDYRKAVRYARTSYQKEKAQECLDKQLRKEQSNLPIQAHGFLAAELGFGSDNNLALSAGGYLFDLDENFNIGAGAIIGTGLMFFSEGDVAVSYTVLDSLKADISFTRFSFFLDLRMQMGDEGSFYIALQPMVNFNSRFSAEIRRIENRQITTKDYEPDDFVSKINYSIRGEFGINPDGCYNLYAFYQYNITPLVSSSKLNAIDAQYQPLSELHHATTFDKKVQRSGSLGIGLRIVF